MHGSVDPTLLVFTLGPGREQARRRWLAPQLASVERALHEQCLDSVLEAGRAAGCALRLATPTGLAVAGDVDVVGQSGRSFGDRLRNAVSEAERTARGPLIVVGTDTPEIGPALLSRALGAVAKRPDAVVLGPSSDGGVYLIAAGRSIAGALGDVRWRSTATLGSLVRALRRSGRPVELLPALSDLDSRQDVERWVARAPAGRSWASIVGRIRAALASLAAAPPFVVPSPVCVPLAAWAGRAPPR